MLFIFEKNRGIGGFEPNARGEEGEGGEGRMVSEGGEVLIFRGKNAFGQKIPPAAGWPRREGGPFIFRIRSGSFPPAWAASFRLHPRRFC